MAFSPELGYLTACPTNVGTGMRASVMMHLPGLVISNQMEKVIQDIHREAYVDEKIIKELFAKYRINKYILIGMLSTCI